MTNVIRLVDADGTDQRHITAEITSTGDLLLSGQDLGPLVREVWGDSDYEYWLTVPASEKDRVLLMLLEIAYAGDEQAVNKLREALDSRGIPCKFDSYA
ncbi:hypothetical protein [uncultured Thiodictyon sp.]|uniref:hypothetical protein n=1 Tax=uncultured Thiodictyon sp. TaxID=1846217 RepID=UPI0025CD1B00|nr:hypothetical protein [uncultured Thiodictyon sp.]